MKKSIILSIVLILIMLGVIISLQPKDKVIIEEETINVEIPKTSEEITRGLMFRESLCDSCGMLFIFEEEKIWSFWMKNTKIPLDIIHINKDLEIVDVIYALPCETDPCPSYIPKEMSTYVLEVNGGKFNESLIGKKAIIEI